MKEEETRVSEILQYYLDGYGMVSFIFAHDPH